jgi:hypothetical protein
MSALAPAAGPVEAVASAPEPAAATTQPVARIATWFAQLADADAAVRENARVALMGLGRADLPTLREVIRSAGALAPAQRVVLRDIVVHSYLAGDTYLSAFNQGFLGVRLPRQDEAGFAFPDDQPELDEKAGVAIQECMPGFAGYRHLREGDVVLSVNHPKQLRTPDSRTLQDAVSSVAGGEAVRLGVLRQGKVIEVEIRLSARPIEAETQPQFQEMIDRRAARAEQYWNEQFAPLVGGGIS